MNIDFVNFLGRLGNRVHPKLIYSFFAVQFSISALVFIFDTGFPPVVVIIGWIIFVVFLSFYLVYTKRLESMEEKTNQEAGLLQMQLISMLKERLQVNPTFHTSCSSCCYCKPDTDSCLIKAEPGERYFRFHHSDKETFCLRWELLNEDGKIYYEQKK